jgi:hypothetical protein
MADPAGNLPHCVTLSLGDAISSRSANDRYRPEGSARLIGDMPPP